MLYHCKPVLNIKSTLSSVKLGGYEVIYHCHIIQITFCLCTGVVLKKHTILYWPLIISRDCSYLLQMLKFDHKSVNPRGTEGTCPPFQLELESIHSFRTDERDHRLWSILCLIVTKIHTGTTFTWNISSKHSDRKIPFFRHINQEKITLVRDLSMSQQHILMRSGN